MRHLPVQPTQIVLMLNAALLAEAAIGAKQCHISVERFLLEILESELASRRLPVDTRENSYRRHGREPEEAPDPVPAGAKNDDWSGPSETFPVRLPHGEY